MGQQNQQAKQGRSHLRKYPILTAMAEIMNSPTIAQEDIKHQFRSSHQKELTGLLEKGVFQIVNLADVPSGSRLFNCWFIDEIKNLGTFEKSRLIMQAYNDDEKKLVLTQSP